MQEGATTAGSPPGLLRCPACGALNPEGAGWCGQCLQRWDAPASELVVPSKEEPAAPSSADDLAARATGGSAEKTRHGAFAVTADGVVWSCSKCESDNSIDDDSCAVCGARLSDALRPEEEITRPHRDPIAVALASLLWPGAGTPTWAYGDRGSRAASSGCGSPSSSCSQVFRVE